MNCATFSWRDRNIRRENHWKKRIDGVYVSYMLAEGQLSAWAIALQIHSTNESYRESPKPSGTQEPSLPRRSLRQASRSPLPVGSDCPLPPLRAASQRDFRARVHRGALCRRGFAAAVAPPLVFFSSCCWSARVRPHA